MDNNSVSKCTGGFGRSLAWCGVANALLVVAKEKSPAVMSLMKRIGGHQWVGHVAVILVLFFVFGWLFTKTGASPGSATSTNRLTGMVVAGTLAGALIIVGFYLFAD
jgi:hypothetical protein